MPTAYDIVYVFWLVATRGLEKKSTNLGQNIGTKFTCFFNIENTIQAAWYFLD